MSGQRGFVDVKERYFRLIAAGTPLEKWDSVVECDGSQAFIEGNQTARPHEKALVRRLMR